MVPRYGNPARSSNSFWVLSRSPLRAVRAHYDGDRRVAQGAVEGITWRGEVTLPSAFTELIISAGRQNLFDRDRSIFDAAMHSG
jgi:hypothetical protein